MVVRLSDPFKLFAKWRDEAADPDSVALATVGVGGAPSVRMVLLRGFSRDGFIFYGADSGRKSVHLSKNPNAALCFYWRSESAESRQVRAEGIVSKVAAAVADSYFASRPRGSKLSAWASRQSRPMKSGGEFTARLKRAEKRFAGVEIPRPPFWNGWLLAPTLIEFWRRGEFRRHHRVVYKKGRSGWVRSLLYP